MFLVIVWIFVYMNTNDFIHKTFLIDIKNIKKF